jgi:hypothetical protein
MARKKRNFELPLDWLQMRMGVRSCHFFTLAGRRNHDVAIAAAVRHQMAVERGEIIEVDSDDEEDAQPAVTPMSSSEIVLLCEKLETACISRSHAGASLELIRHVRKFRGEMHREELQNMKQTSELDGCFRKCL